MNKGIAYVIKTGRHIAPYGDSVAEVLINQKALRQRQQEALSECGYSTALIDRREDIPAANYPCLALSDDLYFNSATIREFVKVSQTGSTQCAISRDTGFAKMFTPFQEADSSDHVKFPLYFLKRADDETRLQIIDPGEHMMPFYIPAHMRGNAETTLPICYRPIIQITHAMDILFANITSLHARFAAALASPLQRTMLVLRAMSAQPARVLSKMNKIGSGCDIHPTASLEGVVIGSKVQVGAHSVIRMSNIGDGCQIGDGAIVKHSVVGSGSVLFNDLTLVFAVCYPEVFLIHGPYHLSVFGRESAMFATILDDFRLDRKPIRIEMNGKLVPFPFPFVGSFIGHRTRVGGGSIIGPGRTIPNDLLIFPGAESVLTRIGRDLPPNVPLFIKNGELQQFGGNTAEIAKRMAKASAGD